jgi:hypothetical protein
MNGVKQENQLGLNVSQSPVITEPGPAPDPVKSYLSRFKGLPRPLAPHPDCHFHP